MNSHELSKTKTIGGDPMDRSVLKDIREVCIDSALPPQERIAQFVGEVKNPYLFRVGNSVVQLGWSDTAKTLQDKVVELFQC